MKVLWQFLFVAGGKHVFEKQQACPGEHRAFDLII
jgi:hypothetical protein